MNDAFEVDGNNYKIEKKINHSKFFLLIFEFEKSNFYLTSDCVRFVMTYIFCWHTCINNSFSLMHFCLHI